MGIWAESDEPSRSITTPTWKTSTGMQRRYRDTCSVFKQPQPGSLPSEQRYTLSFQEITPTWARLVLGDTCAHGCEKQTRCFIKGQAEGRWERTKCSQGGLRRGYLEERHFCFHLCLTWFPNLAQSCYFLTFTLERAQWGCSSCAGYSADRNKSFSFLPHALADTFLCTIFMYHPSVSAQKQLFNATFRQKSLITLHAPSQSYCWENIGTQTKLIAETQRNFRALFVFNCF